MNKTLEKKIQTLYRSGMSLRDIGKKLRMCHETVRRAIPKGDMRWKRMDKKTIKKIVDTYRKCESYQETADLVGIPDRQTIYRVIMRHRSRRAA
jgi:transposase-like protein